ncbi:toprim domain-containing protein [Nocardia sp. NPDC050630]|uniref:toprim domain-containing protein n=1 Tax=Nocardia sp. NPDC050630 TaxID=3364321 RepID=UPI00379994F0
MQSQQPHGHSYEVVTEALTRRMGPAPYPRGPEQWTNYLCPVHESDGQQHNPSLGVRYDPRQGKTMVRCWAKCNDEEVLDRIGLRVRDLWDRLPERDPNRRTSSGVHGQRFGVSERRPLTPVERAIAAASFPILNKPDIGAQTGPGENVDTYVYRWHTDQIEGAVFRMRTPHEHGYAKSFWQARWTGTRWEKGGFAPIPWKLADIREALDTGREIYVCEGEKDVQAANRAGLIATCNAMGAGSWTPEHAKWLRGAGRVIVVADRDRPGYRHAAKVAETLHGQVGEVRVMQARDGKDLSDHFAAGHMLEDLEPVRYLDQPKQQQRPRFRPVSRTRSR